MSLQRITTTGDTRVTTDGDARIVSGADSAALTGVEVRVLVGTLVAHGVGATGWWRRPGKPRWPLRPHAAPLRCPTPPATVTKLNMLLILLCELRLSDVAPLVSRLCARLPRGPLTVAEQNELIIVLDDLGATEHAPLLVHLIERDAPLTTDELHVILGPVGAVG